MQKLLQQLMLALLLVLVVQGVMADAYLDALEEAAGSVEVDPATTGRSDGGAAELVNGNSAEPDTRNMPVGMDRMSLESYLEENYIGSFSFYKRLGEPGKDALFEAYTLKPEIRYVRKKIKEIYLR